MKDIVLLYQMENFIYFILFSLLYESRNAREMNKKANKKVSVFPIFSQLKKIVPLGNPTSADIPEAEFMNNFVEVSWHNLESFQT